MATKLPEASNVTSAVVNYIKATVAQMKNPNQAYSGKELKASDLISLDNSLANCEFDTLNDVINEYHALITAKLSN